MLIENHESAQGKRQRARPKERQEGLVGTVARFTGDLVASIDDGTASRVACPKAAPRFTNLPVGYRTFMSVYRAFLGLGLIEVVTKGSWQRIPEFGPQAGQGKTERIKATDAFIALVRRHGIAAGSAAEHFPQKGRPAPLELRAGSLRLHGEKVRGRLMPIAADETTRRLRGEVEELNDFLAGVRIDGAELTGWTRIFNEGDQEGFAWDRGGRLYARPNGSYQARSKEERLRLTLDGEPVVEIDIRCSHLALVYALMGKSLAEEMRVYDDDGYWTVADPYGIGELPRSVVKAWITSTLGAGARPTRWPRGLSDELKREEGIDLAAFPIRDIQVSILSKHPVLQDLSGITWAKLQLIESEVILRTMLRLKRNHGIPALPVHDSLIVTRQAWWVAFMMLQEELKTATGQTPMRPKITPPMSELPGLHGTRYAHAISQFWHVPAQQEARALVEEFEEADLGIDSLDF
jgi:hypothetical protein